MNIAIILAAGSGKRAKMGQNKVLLPLGNSTVVEHALSAFYEHSKVDETVLVMSKKDEKFLRKNILPQYQKLHMVLGGKTRQHSLENAMMYIREKGMLRSEDDVIIIHNAANPFVSKSEITKVAAEARRSGAAFVGHEVVDTLKEKKTGKTVSRKDFYAAQTPQALTCKILEKGLRVAKKNHKEVTDDVSLAELTGAKIVFIQASPLNKKITTREEYEMAKRYVEKNKTKTLTGIGTDTHIFDSGNSPLILAGILLCDYPKLKANSDGDIVLHAITTAISQALGGGSLGTVADELCRKGEKNSKKYLHNVMSEMKEKGLTISHVGIHIEAKVPRIDPIAEKMRVSLAKILNISTANIGITATSGENMTPFGKGKAIHCIAVVNLEKI